MEIIKNMKYMKNTLDLFSIRPASNYIIKTNTPFRNITMSQVMLVSLSLIMLYFILKHYLYHNIVVNSLSSLSKLREGFTGVEENRTFKKHPYVLKKNNDIFDGFYANIYDKLMYSDVKNSFELGKLSQHTTIDDNTKVLDIGCGTGHHLAQFIELHKNVNTDNVLGIDKSKHMIAKAREYYPEYKDVYRVADAYNSLLFRDNTFSHILCLYFTIYYFKDKYRLLKNCNNWLQSGGVLLLHLVDPNKFDPMVQASNPLEIINVQNYSDKRITNSKVVFNGFDYHSNFDYNYSTRLGKFSEQFIFKHNNQGHVRENEHVLYMDDRDTIINVAKSCGFAIIGTINMYKCGYEHQYLYILEKQV
jgi:SAM-dependent methyltransferase